jgi:hypothetical protein
MLVLVSKGLGVLRWRVVKVNGVEKWTLMLRDVPLLFAESGEYGCPTCEMLLALGWGRDQVDGETLTLVRNASSNLDAPLHVLVDQISPVLRLLDDGAYLVSRVPHSPTNGAGEPFWSLSTEPRPFEASKDLYFSDLGYAKGYPAFLLPTQSLERCNPDRVGEYRLLAARGKELGGLAFWFGGFLSALLDGHHRATAALLERTPLMCLTIIPLTGVEVSDNEKLIALWNSRIPFSALPEDVVRVLDKQHRAARSDERLVLEFVAARSAIEAHCRCDLAAMKKAAATFPTASRLVACSLAGDLSDQRIDELLAAGHLRVSQLWAVLQALIARGDSRATAVAVRIGQGHWPDLWTDAFRYLATVRTDEVEAFFIQFLIRDEGLHPWLGEIADKYLAGHDAREGYTG